MQEESRDEALAREGVCGAGWEGDGKDLGLVGTMKLGCGWGMEGRGDTRWSRV